MADSSSKLGKEHDLRREEERIIAEKAFPSVFCVMMNLRHVQPGRNGASKNSVKEYRNLAKKVKKSETDREFERLPTEPNADDGPRNCTGFVIASEGNKIKILTCAHGLSELYTEGIHKLTCDLINQFFMIEVYCIHQETEIEAMVDPNPVNKRPRYHTPARAVAIDTELDLMVVEVNVESLYLHKVKSKVTPCNHKHPIIKLAKCNPQQADKVVLIGWPAMLSKLLGTGQVSSCDRAFESVTSANKKAYTFKLLLAHGLTCDEGWSGGPVLDGSRDCVGLYHAATETTGYAVSSQDIQMFLQKNGMGPKDTN